MRTKTTRRKRLDRGCLSGVGATTTDAKADLNRQIDVALEGSYDPFLVTFGEYTAVVFRDPNGWNYRLLEGSKRVEEGITQISAGCVLQAGADRNEAVQSAAHHVVQLSPIDYHADDELPAFLTDRDKRQNILSCCRFQRAFRWARDNMPEIAESHSLLHTWACQNSYSPQFA